MESDTVHREAEGVTAGEDHGKYSGEEEEQEREGGAKKEEEEGQIVMC